MHGRHCLTLSYQDYPNLVAPAYQGSVVLPALSFPLWSYPLLPWFVVLPSDYDDYNHELMPFFYLLLTNHFPTTSPTP
jgi:hypothetical protein